MRKSKNHQLEELVKLLLPEILIENFNLVKVRKDAQNEVFDIYLEERKEIPVEFNGLNLHSRGFFDEVTIQDFPIRGFKVLLHIKRRKWKNLETNKNVNRNWDLIAKGTRMTQEFASFLKEINGYKPD